MTKARAVKLGILGLVLLIGSITAYYVLRDTPKRELNAVMKELSIRTARDLTKKLPIIKGFENVLVIPIVGGRDEDTRLKDIIHAQVDNSRKYTTKDWAHIKERLSDGPLWSQFIEKVGIVEEDPPRTLEEAMRASKVLSTTGMKLDGVLIIDSEFTQGPDEDALGSSVELKARFFDLNNGKELKNKSVTARHGIDSMWNRLYLTHKLDGHSVLSRIFLWMLIVWCQPWLLINVVRAVVRKRDNTYNGVLLASFTAVDVTAAWPLLMALAIPGILGMAFIIILIGMTGWYNHDAVDYIDRNYL